MGLRFAVSLHMRCGARPDPSADFVLRCQQYEGRLVTSCEKVWSVEALLVWAQVCLLSPYVCLVTPHPTTGSYSDWPELKPTKEAPRGR